MASRDTADARGPERNRTALGLWPPPRGGGIAASGVALLFAGHWFYGGLINDAALTLGLGAALLLGASLLLPALREELARLRGLALPGAAFALVIVIALWTLTPFVPGGPHPAWAYAGLGRGASTIDRSATTMEIVKLLGLGCVFLLGALAGARDERARWSVRLVLYAGAALGLWAFVASALGLIYQTQGHRLEGHFLNPNTAGTFFAVLLVLSVADLTRSLRRKRRFAGLEDGLPMAGLALTFSVCLLATASRGAVMAALGGLAVLLTVQLATNRLKPSRALLGVIAGLAAVAILVAFTGERLIDRLFESHESAVVRSEIWRLHWAAFLRSPLFGYGLGTAETVNKTLIDGDNIGLLWAIKAILNVYLQWLEEGGLAGAAPMFLCIGALLALTWRGTQRRTRNVRLLAGLLAADAVFLIHGATDFGLEVPSMAAMWAWLLGLQVAVSQGSSRR